MLPEFKESIGRDEVHTHVMRFVKKGLTSKFAVPERVDFVDTLPLTGVGKTDKKKLRAEYRDQPPPGQMPTAAE